MIVDNDGNINNSSPNYLDFGQVDGNVNLSSSGNVQLNISSGLISIGDEVFFIDDFLNDAVLDQNALDVLFEEMNIPLGTSLVEIGILFENIQADAINSVNSGIVGTMMEVVEGMSPEDRQAFFDALNSGDIEFLIQMFNTKFKDKIVETLKEAIKKKEQEISIKFTDLQKTQDEITKANYDAVKAAEKSKKKQKFWGIFGAVMSMVAAVVGAVITTVVTGGIAGAAAIAGAALAIAAGVCSIIAATADISEDAKSKLGWISLGLSIAGCVVSIAGGVTSAIQASRAAAAAVLAAGRVAFQGASTGAATGAVTAFSGVTTGVGTAAFQGVTAGVSNTVNMAAKIMQMIGKIVAGIMSIAQGVVKAAGTIDTFIATSNQVKLEQKLAELAIMIAQDQFELDALREMLQKAEEFAHEFIKEIFADYEFLSELMEGDADTKTALIGNTTA
jgi:hypothetical protein